VEGEEVTDAHQADRRRHDVNRVEAEATDLVNKILTAFNQISQIIETWQARLPGPEHTAMRADMQRVRTQITTTTNNVDKVIAEYL
jgi:hypothetical protein